MAKRREYDRVMPPLFLYRYRPLHDEFSSLPQILESDNGGLGHAQNLMMRRIWFSPVTTLRTRKSRVAPAEDTQKFMDNTGVLCLSGSAKHPKLWELYAAGGRGVCIKLESDFIVDPDNGPFRVSYSDDPKPLWRAFRTTQTQLCTFYGKKGTGLTKVNGAVS